MVSLIDQDQICWRMDKISESLETTILFVTFQPNISAAMISWLNLCQKVLLSMLVILLVWFRLRKMDFLTWMSRWRERTTCPKLMKSSHQETLFKNNSTRKIISLWNSWWNQMRKSRPNSKMSWVRK